MNQAPEQYNLPATQRVLAALRLARSRLEAAERVRTEPIAVVGIGCRFPGGDGPNAFWEMLSNGRDLVRSMPAERYELGGYADSDRTTRYGSFLEHVDRFDAEFFGISPREAESLDPQQRLLLEVVWEALEHAGQAPDRLSGSSTGVFVGMSQNDYALLQLQQRDPQKMDAYVGTGGGLCFGPGRVAHLLGLRGPNMAVDTACSSSLLSVHLACQSLRLGECDLALAGGVHLALSPHLWNLLATSGALSPDGQCRAFDASASGFGRGEGCGIVVMRRLSDALDRHDHILAVIRGSAINHDGTSSGLTVPNELAQEELLRRALNTARINPSAIDFVEAHGTGTSLGDPIEAAALASVFGPGRAHNQPLLIGSVKTNIGHLEAASGIAGLIKVVLSLSHERIPASLHLRSPTPRIPWDEVPIVVAAEAMPWPRGTRPRIAGVSSFGMSGANSHVVIEEAPLVPAAQRPSRRQHLLTLSARTPTALVQLATRLDEWLVQSPKIDLADLSFTASAGRAHFDVRTSIVADCPDATRQALASIICCSKIPSRIDSDSLAPKVALLFPGHGSQYRLMGRQLFDTQASFRRTVLRCDELYRAVSGSSLLNVLDPLDKCDELFHQAEYSQPALFALEYAIAELLRVWGIQPAAVLGQDVGEVVAAVVAGVFSLEEGFNLVVERAQDRFAGDVAFAHPAIELISSQSGCLATLEVTESRYWSQPARKPVAYSIGLATLYERGYRIFVECGPKPTLCELASNCLPEDAIVLPCLSEQLDDWQQLLETVGQLYERGVAIDWEAFHRDDGPRHVALPTYPFQREQYWFDADIASKVGSSPTASMELIQKGEQKADEHCQYELSWQRRDGTAPSSGLTMKAGGRWLLFADSMGVARRLQVILEEKGQECLLVYASERYQRLSKHEWSLNPTQADDVRRLLDDCAATGDIPLRAIVHLWSLDAAKGNALTAVSLDEAQRLGFAAALHLTQALVQRTCSAPLWLVTRQAVSVPSDKIPADGMAQSPLWGLGKVIALEHPEVWGGMLDLPPECDDRSLTILVDQICSMDHEDHVAIRSGQRYVARIRPQRQSSHAVGNIHDDGTYLITGGLGTLGLHVTRWLVDQGARHIVLTARRDPNAYDQAAIRMLEDRGARVLVAKADVTSQQEMADVFQQIRSTLPPLRGVVHCAGAAGYHPLAELDWEAASTVLRPKVMGSWVLHQATRDIKMDFFVEFSSVASLWGSKGQSHYAAANSFLDGLAHFRRGLGLPATSVNWGPWSGGGMVTDEALNLLSRSGLKAFIPERALDLFGRLLQMDAVQTAIVDVDWRVFLELYEAKRRRPLLDDVRVQMLRNDHTTSPGAMREEIERRFKALSPQQSRLELIAWLQAEVAAVLRLPSGRLPDATKGFFKLGMDSLMAVELTKQLQKATGRKFPATLAFDFPSVNQLAEHLLGEWQIDKIHGNDDLPAKGALSEGALSEGALSEGALSESISTIDEAALTSERDTGLTNEVVDRLLAEKLSRLESLIGEA